VTSATPPKDNSKMKTERVVKRILLNRWWAVTSLVITISLIVCLAACERPITITLDGKNPPSFIFSGHGELRWISVYELTTEGRVPPEGSAVWKIQPLGPLNTRDWPQITYGVVPRGFSQVKPDRGAPPSLQEGHTYGIGAVTRNVLGANIWFAVRNGQSIRVRKTEGEPDRDLPQGPVLTLGSYLLARL